MFLEIIIEMLLVAAGATGFAVIFKMNKKRLWIVGLISGTSWGIYKGICYMTQNDIVALFIITVIIVMSSQFISKYINSTAILFATPILIPYIPGSTLYLVMSDFINRRSTFSSNLRLLLYQVGAMALGLILTSYLELFTSYKKDIY